MPPEQELAFDHNSDLTFCFSERIFKIQPAVYPCFKQPSITHLLNLILLTTLLLLRMWSLGQRYFGPLLPGSGVCNGETCHGKMSTITLKHQEKRLKDSCWERLNSIETFTNEHSEIKTYHWRKAAALKSERSPRKAFWKTLHFHLCLIAHQDFFSRDPWGAGAGLMWLSFPLSGFAAGPCHSTPAGPLSVEICVLDSWGMPSSQCPYCWASSYFGSGKSVLH